MSFRRLFSLVIAAALILAPATMMGGSPAMAMDGQDMAAMGDRHTASPPSPCHDDKSQADDQAPDSKRVPGSCCVMTCVAIPAVGGELAVHLPPQRMNQPVPPASRPHGLEPEADPPPPRFS
ncbi:MAG TPA: hypothetical protein VIT45_05115 [Allosphingosinicella sp.]